MATCARPGTQPTPLTARWSEAWSDRRGLDLERNAAEKLRTEPVHLDGCEVLWINGWPDLSFEMFSASGLRNRALKRNTPVTQSSESRVVRCDPALNPRPGTLRMPS